MLVDIFCNFGLNTSVTKHNELTADEGQFSDAVPTFLKYFYCNPKCLETKCDLEKQHFMSIWDSRNCSSVCSSLPKSGSSLDHF